MSLNYKLFILAICCSIISHYSLVYGQQPSPATVDYNAEFNKLCEQLSSDPYNAELYPKLKVLLGNLPDINEQCRCAAIYCLAVSVAGNSDEASKAIRFIEKKNPNSAYLQRLSGNNLSENCPNCNGEGTTTSQCKTCGGSGQCSMCKGRGSLEGIGGKDRSCSCMGSGKCKQCAGTGNTKLKCQKCGGKGKILSSQSLKNEYLALLNEKISKQSNITVATGQDANNEQKNEETVSGKPFEEKSTPMKSMAQLYGGSTFGEHSGKEGSKGSDIVKQKNKESDQQLTQSSNNIKSTGVILNKTETDCDQQYGKSLKSEMMEDGYKRAEYEKDGVNIDVIFNSNSYIEYISFISKKEPFTEEQRKVLLVKYSNNQAWYINRDAGKSFLQPSFEDVDYMFQIQHASQYAVFTKHDGSFMGFWERDDGSKAKYYSKDGYILEIWSINYLKYNKKEQEKREIEQKQKEKNKVDGL